MVALREVGAKVKSMCDRREGEDFLGGTGSCSPRRRSVGQWAEEWTLKWTCADSSQGKGMYVSDGRGYEL